MTFRIFKPKFTLTRTRIINYTCMLFLAISYTEVYLLDNEKIIVSKILIPIALILWIIGSFYRMNNLNQIKQYQGIFVGQIVFNLNEISVHSLTKEQFKITEIKHIEFNIRTIKGLYDGRTTAKFYYENGLANGTENKITIELKNGLTKTYQMEYTPENIFAMHQQLIEHYYTIGIINYLDGVELLGLDKREDWEKFKKLRA